MPRPPRPPAFVLLFVSLFGFIGIGVIVFLWSARGFGEPPLFFKLFGSAIAVGFMLLGFGLPINALRASSESGSSEEGTHSASAGYKCPNCGAGLQGAEVSPSGDVKCSYCSRWYNIHR